MNKADKPEDPTPRPMRHALCLVSHELPGDEPGRFRRYEAGTVYEVDEPDEVYFRAVYGGTEGISSESGVRSSEEESKPAGTEADAQRAEGIEQRGSKRKSA